MRFVSVSCRLIWTCQLNHSEYFSADQSQLVLIEKVSTSLVPKESMIIPPQWEAHPLLASDVASPGYTKRKPQTHNRTQTVWAYWCEHSERSSFTPNQTVPECKLKTSRQSLRQNWNSLSEVSIAFAVLTKCLRCEHANMQIPLNASTGQLFCVHSWTLTAFANLTKQKCKPSQLRLHDSRSKLHGNAHC